MKRSAMLLLALLATGCASSPAVAPAAREAAVREAMNGFVEAVNALDMDRIAAFFADDVTAFAPSGQADRIDGKPAVVEAFGQLVEAARKMTARPQLVAEDLEVDADGNIAVATFNIRNPGSVLRRTFTFRHEGGRWLIVHFHASNVRLPNP